MHDRGTERTYFRQKDPALSRTPFSTTMDLRKKPLYLVTKNRTTLRTPLNDRATTVTPVFQIYMAESVSSVKIRTPSPMSIQPDSLLRDKRKPSDMGIHDIFQTYTSNSPSSCVFTIYGQMSLLILFQSDTLTHSNQGRQCSSQTLLSICCSASRSPDHLFNSKAKKRCAGQLSHQSQTTMTKQMRVIH